MRSDRFTNKATEALQEAHAAARRSGHPEVRPLHLLLALACQPDGVVAPILQRLGADPRAVATAAKERLTAISRVEGDVDVRLSRSLTQILETSEKIAKEFKDEYLSAEHFLLALARSEGEASRILARLGASEPGILTALREVRGSSRITDPDPEDKYQALERYGRDLTAMARQGKLDPAHEFVRCGAGEARRCAEE